MHMPRLTVTRRVHFSAAHRLHDPALSDEDNARIFGPCSNPNYHGHNYELDVSVEGEVSEETLYNNGDESFAVKVELTRAGEEAVWFSGLLDHSDLPPSVRGCILQVEPSDPPTTDPCG